MPLWTAQLLTGTKSFERNRLIGSERLNRQRAARGAGSAGAPGRGDAPPPPGRSMVSSGPARGFARDGFVMRRDFLPPGDFGALLDQVKSYRGGLREIVEGDTIMRKIALGPRRSRRAAGAATRCCARRNGAG